ncbi:hypothetical protein GCM10009530_20490 [Microbispora corallina]|uniref:Antitoxin HicB n=1 Tax=Microbispora corallina TaxID=83302 RepID=A0ABQ4FTY4_9ACTN|nr:type II toxin-antitoxin system HicB family antitoxin [Microbispora corallina]GIH38291.1 hypothetical protein Mco01_12910 [Microbispora corallina]
MRTPFEAILDQPDIVENLDDLEVESTTYHATATRTGRQWTVTVNDLPEGRAVQAQGATWTDAEQNALTCVIDLLQAEPHTVNIHLAPNDEEAAAALAAVTEARVARAYAEQAERDAVRQAARILTDKGWTTRDAGGALRLSHQRISQLAPRTTA